MSQSSYKMWGGRFSEKPHEALQSLNNSLPYDSRLYADDLDASKAYAEALHRAGHLKPADPQEGRNWSKCWCVAVEFTFF